MTDTPDVPHRFTHEIEVPGTAEQVWEAIATAEGITAWMLPTDLEERAGGAVVFHMGDDSSSGRVTAYEAPRRFAYEEPEWARLAGHADARVTPMATEFLVEARHGGTCVVRVVTSAFGTGADWEHEFWAGMSEGWRPMLETLRSYVTHFAGRRGVTLEANHVHDADADAVWASMRRAVDGGRLRDLEGVVESQGDHDLTLRVVDPVEGLLLLAAHAHDDGTYAMVLGHLYGENSEDYVRREQAGWQAWVEQLLR